MLKHDFGFLKMKFILVSRIFVQGKNEGIVGGSLG